MVPVSNEELEALCNYLSTASYIYYPIATSFFHDLYVTGCRPNELLQIDRWTYIDTDHIELVPLKDNLTRSFTQSELSSDLVFSIIHQVAPYQGLTLRQLTSVMKKILPLIKIQTIDKSAIDYMFRYNKVKSLKDNGNTYPQITEKFGWNNEALAIGYYERVIYRVGELPPVDTFYLIDSDGSALIDEDGTFIIYPSTPPPETYYLIDSDTSPIINDDGTFLISQ